MQNLSIDWDVGERSGRVLIGTHSLFLQAIGQDRKPGEPVAIIIPGLASSSKSWAAVVRLIRPVVRTYVYDRSGFGQSDVSPNWPTSTTIAAELDILLKSANIEPPYILVTHSWGGILSREFITIRPNDIAGLVFVDANHEQLLERLDWRDPAIWAVGKDIDFFDVTGITRDHQLTQDEWRTFREEEASLKHKTQTDKENAVYAKSFPIMAEKGQLYRNPPLLGNRTVCVIMGLQHSHFEKLYAAGLKRGNGTKEEQMRFRQLLDVWAEKHSELQLEQLSLSGNSRFVIAEKSGHSVQLTQPELIASMVQWVVQEFAHRFLGRI